MNVNRDPQPTGAVTGEKKMKSINQLAQESGDSSLNEANRIRENEATVARAWRKIAYDENEAACTTERIASVTGLPIAYVHMVCERRGWLEPRS